MLRYKNTFPRILTPTLIVVWFFVLFGGGSIAASNVPRWSDTVAAQHTTVSTVIPLRERFNKVSIDEDRFYRVRIMQGPTTSVRLNGEKVSIDQIIARIENGELHIDKKQRERWRLFDNIDEPEITIIMPLLEKITVNRNSRVELSGFQQPKLAIVMNNGTLRTNDSNIAAYDIKQNAFSVVNIESGTSTLKAELGGYNTRLSTLGVMLSDADIKLGTRATVHLGTITNTLSVVGGRGSKLYYSGTPNVHVELADDAEVAPYPPSLWSDEERSEYYGQDYSD